MDKPILTPLRAYMKNKQCVHDACICEGTHLKPTGGLCLHTETCYCKKCKRIKDKHAT